MRSAASDGCATTGFEDDRDLHIAMNAGLPLVDPTGGFYYVFITGRPIFRKYSATGALVFERHIEGRELDVVLESQPTRWPRRRVQDREVPLVTPVVRAAGVEPDGRAVGVAGRAVHLRLRHRRRQGPHRAVQRRRHHQPDQPVLQPQRQLLVTPGCYEFDPKLEPRSSRSMDSGHPQAIRHT